MPLGNRDGLVDAGGRAVGRLRDAELRARSSRSAGDPPRCRSRRATCRGSSRRPPRAPRVSLSGVWPPSCTITPIGCSRSHDLQHILQRQRLEVQLVGDVEVGGDRFGIRVDHDRLVSALAQRDHGAHAAVVELHALPDPIRAGAEDDDRLASAAWRFALLVVAAVQVRRRATETRRRRCRPSCTTAARRAPSDARAPPLRFRRATPPAGDRRSPCASCDAATSGVDLRQCRVLDVRRRAARASDPGTTGRSP